MRGSSSSNIKIPQRQNSQRNESRTDKTRKTKTEEKNIENITKTFIFKPLVQSVMLYDAETCTIGKHHESKLLGTEMDFWQKTARQSRKEKILIMIIVINFAAY